MACEATLKYSYAPKELADKKLKERKLNILILIQHFLKNEGYIDTYEQFKDEAKLSAGLDICDNIDLNNIIQDYETYYYIRFQKYPKYSRKRVKDDCEERKLRNKFKSITKDVSKNVCSKSQNLGLSLESSLQVLALGENEKLNESGDNISVKLFKPLGSFEGYCDEWKSLADVIIKEVVSKDLNVKWEDIKGLNYAKDIVKEAIVYPIKYPELYKGILAPWRGLLLYGPSGTGKTQLAKAVATECNCTFFNISASSIVSKWRGDSEKLVRVMFELARHEAPSTIFIDEIDALASCRGTSHEHEASRRLKSELLVQLDGLCQNNDDIFFLAATNLPWDLDPALLRRLEKKLFIDVPDSDARLDIFRMFLPPVILRQPQLHVDVDYSTLAQNSKGYSGAELKLVSKEAAMRSVRKLFLDLENKIVKDFQSVKLPSVTEKDVITVLKEVKPSGENIQEYLKWTDHSQY